MQWWTRRRQAPTSEEASILSAAGFDFLESVGEELPTTLRLHIGQYVRAIETETTEKWCRCEWIIHPDDVNKRKGTRRKRRGDTHFDCPVHTREGFIMGFLIWYRNR